MWQRMEREHLHFNIHSNRVVHLFFQKSRSVVHFTSKPNKLFTARVIKLYGKVCSSDSHNNYSVLSDMMLEQEFVLWATDTFALVAGRAFPTLFKFKKCSASLPLSNETFFINLPWIFSILSSSLFPPLLSAEAKFSNPYQFASREHKEEK